MLWRIGGYLSSIYVVLLGVSVSININFKPVWGTSQISLVEGSTDPWFLIYLLWWRDSRTAIAVYFLLLLIFTIPVVVAFFRKGVGKSWKLWFSCYTIPVSLLIVLTNVNEAYLASWKIIEIKSNRVGTASSPISHVIEWIDYSIPWIEWLTEVLILAWPATYFLFALAITKFLENSIEVKQSP